MQTTLLTAGMEAPHFTLPDADMEPFSITAVQGQKNIVLYFYPETNARCGITEAREFSELDDDFNEHDTLIIGVSRDDCLNLADIRDSNGLTVLLLSDPDARVCKRYGVTECKTIDGHRRNIVHRATFIIDKQGTIQHVLYDVHAHGHPQEVLNLIKGLA